MRRLVSYFVQGLLFIAPITVTIWAILSVVSFIDEIFLDDLAQFLGYRIPGLGLLSILLAITIIGFVGSTFIFRPFIGYFDHLISKAPLIKIIYTAVKDFLQAFVGQQKKFTEPVLVRIDDKNEIDRIGFITGKDLAHLGIESGRVAVYFPSSYTVLGELLIVPMSRIRPLNANPAEVMKYVISGGVSYLESKPLTRKIIENE